MKIHDRYSFFDIWFNATNLEETTEFLLNYDYQKTGYVAFADSSVVVSAQKDELLRKSLNNALLNLPDGKPAQLAARLNGISKVSTVSGYWLCKNLLDSELSHYFLGSTEEKLQMIRHNINKNYPHARVLGFSSPPFYDIGFYKSGNLLSNELLKINQLQPDLIWIGISSPKQDFLMLHHVPELKHGLMLGVGGVFDYLSGDVKKSPEWIKKIGLRWLWRVIKEPRRLGPKYLMTIRFFVFRFFRKLRF